MTNKNCLKFIMLLMPSICFLQTNIFPTSGNVGIGTTNPRSTLDVNGTLTWGSGAKLSTTQGASIELRGDGFPFLDFSNDPISDYDVRFLLRSNDALEILGGKIGIGTGAPQELLHVAGNIVANKVKINDPDQVVDWNTIWQSGFYEGFEFANSPEPYGWFWGINMNHGSNYSEYRYSGQIAVKNDFQKSIMYFRSTNRDGEGIWTKVLHNTGNQAVNGKLEAKEIKVTSTPTADFVFEEEYRIPSLEMLEDFIKTNKHLPEIDSAKEMKENGVNIGEFQIQLLQKIEELTLYTIRQEKKIKSQEIVISGLKNENKKIIAIQKRMDQLEKAIINLK